MAYPAGTRPISRKFWRFLAMYNRLYRVVWPHLPRKYYWGAPLLNEPCLCEAVAWAMLRARVLGPALLFGPAHCQFIRRRVVGRATSGEYSAGAVVGGSKRRVALLRPPCHCCLPTHRQLFLRPLAL